MMLSEDGVQYEDQGAIRAHQRGAFIYRLNDGRKIAYTANLRIEDLQLRKGGGCDPIHRHSDNTFWLTPAEGSTVYGIVIRETGKPKEAFAGIAEFPKPEKKHAESDSGLRPEATPQA